MSREILTKITSNPQRLFLIDGAGALPSAVLLGIVLVKLQPIFGIPKSTLYFLAFLPCVFAVYDFFCYFKVRQNGAPFLKVIVWANLLCCCLSVGLVFYHSSTITTLGWAYILIEVAVVTLLIVLEFKGAARR